MEQHLCQAKSLQEMIKKTKQICSTIQLNSKQYISCGKLSLFNLLFNNGEQIMSKSKDTKKETKKAPAKTMKEKKAEKKIKAADKSRLV